MTKEQIEKQQNKGLKYVLFTAAIFFIVWIIYLTSFYSYYKEAYFYIDKRYSYLYQLLIIVNDNLQMSVIFLSLSALLITVTFVFMYFILLTNKKKAYPKTVVPILFGLNALYILSLFINVYGSVFFIIAILSGSIVYALVTLGKKEDNRDTEYEEGDILETKGPFETVRVAQEATQLFLENWTEQKTVVLGKEIYQKEDDQYYVEIYVETVKK